jgi:hypothetical protein
MKYLPYEKEQIVSVLIYCNGHEKEETAEDIAKAITTDFFVGKFTAKEHVSIASPIKNDDNMFILRDIYGHDNIWQVCGKASDYVGAIIPHLYKVRKIGIMFD